MATDLRAAAEQLLLTPRPADATALSAEKAKAIAIDRHRRKGPVGERAINAGYQRRRTARAAKNTAYCPDRPAELVEDKLPASNFKFIPYRLG